MLGKDIIVAPSLSIISGAGIWSQQKNDAKGIDKIANITAYVALKAHISLTFSKLIDKAPLPF